MLASHYRLCSTTVVGKPMRRLLNECGNTAYQPGNLMFNNGLPGDRTAYMSNGKKSSLEHAALDPNDSEILRLVLSYKFSTPPPNPNALSLSVAKDTKFSFL